MHYWLMKSEPDVFGVDDLKKVEREPWDGIRNYQARNYIREMRPGDLAFFYHSNQTPPGIAGIMKIVSEPYPDSTAFDPNAHYYDPKSDPKNPRWYLVDVAYIRHLNRFLSLDLLRQQPELKSLPLVQKGSRLSIMPIDTDQWNFILSLEETS